MIHRNSSESNGTARMATWRSQGATSRLSSDSVALLSDAVLQPDEGDTRDTSGCDNLVTLSRWARMSETDNQSPKQTFAVVQDELLPEGPPMLHEEDTSALATEVHENGNFTHMNSSRWNRFTHWYRENRQFFWTSIAKFLAALFFVLLMILFVSYVAESQFFVSFAKRMEEFGPFSPLVYVILYAFFCSLLIPGELLTVSGGFLFSKLFSGTGAVLIGSLSSIGGLFLCAVVCFSISRFLLRTKVERFFSRFRWYPVFTVATSMYGGRLVFLFRLTPLFPFAVTSYAFGVSPIKFKNYFWGTLGCIPGVIILTILGCTVVNWKDLDKSFAGLKVPLLTLFVVSLVIFAACVAYISWRIYENFRRIREEERFLEETSPC